MVEGFTLVGTGDVANSCAGISVQSDLGARLGNDAVSGNHEDIVLRGTSSSYYISARDTSGNDSDEVSVTLRRRVR